MTDSDYENCRECDASARDPKLYADISSASSTRRMHAVRHLRQRGVSLVRRDVAL